MSYNRAESIIGTGLALYKDNNNALHRRENMGNQQMLLIVMGVIIVGIAVVAGFTLFNHQQYNSNQKNLGTEMATYIPLVYKYWESRKMIGGAEMDTTEVSPARVAGYIGFTGANYSTSSENGEIRITQAAATTVVLEGLGKEKRKGKFPYITATLNLATGNTQTEIGAAESW